MSDHDTTGWTFTDTNTAAWQETPDGTKFKMVGVADGFVMVYSELAAGGAGSPHEHSAPEFLYVLEGDVKANGVEMKAGHGYSAPAGTKHTEFASTGGCKFISVFKLG